MDHYTPQKLQISSSISHTNYYVRHVQVLEQFYTNLNIYLCTPKDEGHK